MHVFSRTDWQLIDPLLLLALTEDIGTGDVTSQAVVPESATAKANIVARQDLVVCGIPVVARLLALYRAQVQLEAQQVEGKHIRQGEVIATLSGNAQTLLTVERVVLNLLQRMSGVATLTAQFVEAVKGTSAKMLDTRKTIPGWRLLDKHAVRIGGGANHRTGLYDAIMIKDNHIAYAGGIVPAIQKALAGNTAKLPLIVECDTLEQVEQVLNYPVTRLLLDNMDIDTLKKAVLLVAGKMQTEASGGVNLQTVRNIAETGVDFISVGQLTHSAKAADIALDFV